MEEKKAKGLHLMPYDDLLQIVGRRKAEAIILENIPSKANFMWSIPSFNLVDQNKWYTFMQIIQNNYIIGFEKAQILILVPKR